MLFKRHWPGIRSGKEFMSEELTSISEKEKPQVRKTRRRRQAVFALVTMIFAVAMLVQLTRLYQKQRNYKEKAAVYQKELLQQQERAKEIEDQVNYTMTDAYTEREAQSKLGMVHPNEIIFREKK